MTVSSSTLVADVVLEHPECALVFRAHSIDFCCGGRISVEEAATRRELRAERLTHELDAAIARRAAPVGADPRGLDTAALITLIVERHHAYLRRTLPPLVEMAAKVARVHGDRDPALVVVAARVRRLAELLLPHLDGEEAVLFPEISRAQAGATVSPILEAELASMHAEHLAVGSLLEELRSLTADYIPPGWACTTYRTLLSELAACESDTHQHVHLENNVLAPRVQRATAAPAAHDLHRGVA